MPVIDASVYVALCHQADPEHERCRAWLEEALENRRPLFAPNMLVIEVGSSIRRLTGDEETASRAVTKLLADGWIELLPLSGARSRSAATTGAQTGVRGADAVYLALALELREPLVTIDKQQLVRGSAVTSVERP